MSVYLLNPFDFELVTWLAVYYLTPKSTPFIDMEILSLTHTTLISRDALKEVDLLKKLKRTERDHLHSFLLNGCVSIDGFEGFWMKVWTNHFLLASNP